MDFPAIWAMILEYVSAYLCEKEIYYSLHANRNEIQY